MKNQVTHVTQEICDPHGL